jgi:hypothetical protein
MCYRGTLGKSNQEIQRSCAVDESSKSKRTETREFWEEAIRLWTDSGLSVREFCDRGGVADDLRSDYTLCHTFASSTMGS